MNDFERNSYINFRTIASFDSAMSAWVYQNALAHEGINAIVTDEHITTTYWLYANATGGIKVQIPESQWGAFNKISHEPVPADIFTSDDPEQETEHCPRCQEPELFLSRWHAKLFFLTWFFLGIPIPVYWTSFQCCQCDYRSLEAWDISTVEKLLLTQVPRQFSIRHLFVLMIGVSIIFGTLSWFQINWLELMAKPKPPIPF